MLHIVCVEGLIGSGKSTLLAGLRTHGYRVLTEPLHDWLDSYRDNDGSILEHLYADPKRWGFTFQVMALWTRAKSVKEAIQECQRDNVPVLIIERSLLSTYQIFTKVLIQNGSIGPIESRLFRDIHESLMQGMSDMLYSCIYIKTDPEVCMQRIQRRARNGEMAISQDYLTMLHRRHEQWLNMVNHYEIDGTDTAENVLISALYYLRAMFN